MAIASIPTAQGIAIMQLVQVGAANMAVAVEVFAITVCVAEIYRASTESARGEVASTRLVTVESVNTKHAKEVCASTATAQALAITSRVTGKYTII
jgi:hypothetical protein